MKQRKELTKPSEGLPISGMPASLFGSKVSNRYLAAMDRAEEQETKTNNSSHARHRRPDRDPTLFEDVAPRAGAFKQSKKWGEDTQGRTYRIPSKEGFKSKFPEAERDPSMVVVIASIRGNMNRIGFPFLREIIVVNGKSYEVVNAIISDRPSRAYATLCLKPL